MQRFDRPRRVMVLVEDHDGRQHGWELLDNPTAGWEFAGVGPNGTRSTLRATGTFHRISRRPNDEAELMPGTIELEGPTT